MLTAIVLEYLDHIIQKSWIRILLEKPFDQKIKNPDKPYHTMDLCPKCAKKLKKLIMAVEGEDSDV